MTSPSTTYRLYTEDSPTFRKSVGEVLDRHFDAYTLIPSEGVWHGQHEHSLIAEVTTDKPADVECAAEEIRLANHQQAVLVTSQQTVSHLVTDKEMTQCA